MSPMPRDCNEGRPQGLKVVGPVLLVCSGYTICVGQRVEQVLPIEIMDRKGENGIVTGYPRFDCIVPVLCQTNNYAVLLLLIDDLTHLTLKRSLTNKDYTIQLHSIDFWSSAKHHLILPICLCTADED